MAETKLSLKPPPLSSWDWRECPNGEGFCWSWGSVRVWLDNTPLEWKVATDYKGDAYCPGKWESITDWPEDLPWERWSFAESVTSLRFQPILPSSPIIVRPDDPVTIPSGHEARFLISIPLSLMVEVDKDKPSKIAEVPLVLLSKTWFGLPVEGELGLVLKSGAARTLEETKLDPVMAVCPLIVKNTSEEPLPIQKFCLRLDFATLFQGEQRLWTSAHVLDYAGAGNFKDADFVDPTPYISESNLEVVRKARKALSHNVLKRGFSNLVSFVS